MNTPLTISTAKNLVGKTIRWAAAGYNRKYSGVAKITGFDQTLRNPITCEVIEGDELFYAHIADYGLKTYKDGFEMDTATTDYVLCYTDDFREIIFEVI